MKKVLISPEISLKEAINRLNELGTKTLVVSNEENKLLGTLSDGDIRRAIINGNNLDENIENIYNQVVFLAPYLSVVRDELTGNPIENSGYYEPEYIENTYGQFLPSVGLIIEL